MRSVWIVHYWSKCQSSDICGVFCINQGTDFAKCYRRVASGNKVAGAIRSLQLVCARVLHEILLMLVLLYGSEKMIWRGKELSRIRAV